MPAGNLSDGYSEYIMMNDDLKGKTRDQLYDMVIMLRAAIRFHKEYKEKYIDVDNLLYIHLPEERKPNQ